MAKIVTEAAPAWLGEEANANARALAANPYPGRGLVVGADTEGKRIVQVYWIMGRSENSRNRVFREADDGSVRTQAADPAKCADPSLIIYTVARHSLGAWIVSNGDQTDTIAKAMEEGKNFESALETREYEPDAPNFTSRISCIVDPEDADSAFRLSLLRRNSGGGCDRFTWAFAQAQAGMGRFISTYAGDGNPLPPFRGEPQALPIPPGGPKEVAEGFWKLLNPENRISIMARIIDADGNGAQTYIINSRA